MIEKLTREQEALIPVIREKWKNIAFSTEPIDRQQVTEAIKAAYALIGRNEPKIIIFDSPLAVILELTSSLDNKIESKIFKNSTGLKKFTFVQVSGELEPQLFSGLITPFMLSSQVEEQLKEQLLYSLSNLKDEVIFVMKQELNVFIDKLNKQLESELENELLNTPLTQQSTLQWKNDLHKFNWNRLPAKVKQTWMQLNGDPQVNAKLARLVQIRNKIVYGGIDCAEWALEGSCFDFKFSVLNLEPESSKKWEIFQSIVKSCGWIFPFEEMCFVCDRPQILSFDSQNRLHAEGSPAIQFADGFSLYCHHGVLLPEQYGKVHPNEWRSQWLLEEQNAELRRVLIQGIGYERICQELQASELDNWQEYALLKINADVDEEEIYLLKMACPSTGHIHVLRVPPTIQSAREAISWVNWGVDPEDFSVQT